MKKKWMIMAGIVCIMLAVGLSACKRGCRVGGFDEFDLSAATNRIASQLDLTESQKTQLDQIAGEIMEKAASLHVDRETHRQELADLVRQETLERSAVDEMVDTKMAKMREMADFALDRLIVFHETLSEEQRETIAARIEDNAAGGCRLGFR